MARLNREISFQASSYTVGWYRTSVNEFILDEEECSSSQTRMYPYSFVAATPPKNIKLPSLRLDIYSKHLYPIYALQGSINKNPSALQRFFYTCFNQDGQKTALRKQHVSRASSPLFALIPAKEFQCVTFPGPSTHEGLMSGPAKVEEYFFTNRS